MSAYDIGGADTDAHVAQAADAHDASAISIADAGGFYTATDVEAALQVAGMVKIEEIVRGTDGQIDFQNIPSGFKNLRIEAYLRSAQSNTEEAFRVRLNNDASTVCQGGYMSFVNTSFSAGNDVAGAYILCGFVLGNSAGASRFSAITIDIPLYSGTSFYKSILTKFTAINSTTAASVRIGTGGGVWPVTGAINRVLLWTGSGSGNFLTGSRATLYGLT